MRQFDVQTPQNFSQARHARMFELLRQSHQAALTAERLAASGADAERGSADAWRKAAIHSLGPRRGARRAGYTAR